jgi:hypothetical protein
MSRKSTKDGARSGVAALWPFRGRGGRPQRPDGPARSGAIRPVRSLAAMPAAAAVLVAVTAAAGGASASAATVHTGPRAAHAAPGQLGAGRGDARQRAAAVTGVSWHTLSLLSGWQSDQGTYNSGNPSWAVKSGVVYLSGSLHQPIAGFSEFAVLPAAARPAHSLVLPVYTVGGTTGDLYIQPTGQAFIFASGDAQAYTSLAGVSFPAATTAVHTLSLLNGWQTSQSVYSNGDPAYRVAGGVVYLTGSLDQPSGTNDEFAVLPAAARPARTLYLTVYTDAGTTGVLKISPNGVMLAYQGNAQTFTSLAGMSFPAATTALHTLSLRNGWQSSQSAYGTGNPAYTVTGSVVNLSGSMHQSAGTSTEFAVLPPAARPTHNLWIKTYTYNGAVGALEITPSGVMYAFNSSGNAAQAYTSLAAISYPLGS